MYSPSVQVYQNGWRHVYKHTLIYPSQAVPTPWWTSMPERVRSWPGGIGQICSAWSAQLTWQLKWHTAQHKREKEKGKGKQWEVEQVVLTQVHISLHWVIRAFRVLCTRYSFTHPLILHTHCLLTQWHYSRVSAAMNCTSVVIAQSRLSGLLCLMQKVVKIAGNKCLWFTSPFDREHKVDNIPLFALPLVTNCSNLLKTGPRGVWAAKCKNRATHDRKDWQTSSV